LLILKTLAGRAKRFANCCAHKSRRHLWQLQRDLHDTVLISQVTILQSRELIAKVDEALTRRYVATPF
jgi:hypothetical protein